MNENKILSELIPKFDNKINPFILIFDKSERKDKYKTHQVNFEEEVSKDIAKIYLQTMLKILKTTEIEKYDFELNKKDTIQKLEMKLVIESDNIKFKIKKEESTPFINRSTNFKIFDFVVIQFYLKEKDEIKILTIYSKYKQPANKFKKSFKYCFLDDEIKKLDSDILYFDGLVDAFEIDNNYYIINENAFSSIFDFKEGFNKIIENKRSDIVSRGFVDNPNEFINDCKSDGRYNKRLCNVVESDAFEYIDKGKHKLPEFFKKFKISLKLDKNNIIKYRGKEDIGEILNILMKRYAQDGLLENRMIIKGVEEYIS
ncbi:Kiwa anti-phage protein KwaB-like domain-containing protein [Clostridium sp.]|uniref:Kiwa anti-phage protein KwaB-like domain-containing protein n=1 Tax=Clostridium sp. TaxID=1506 RepID=UPI001A3E7AE9|nr:Kiwa anti-phage protein KwaB-like domain-containing protein [Clostridium sp.]MBK5242062.1 DUF4868 domain-containing protein [Clostridium sp.]